MRMERKKSLSLIFLILLVCVSIASLNLAAPVTSIYVEPSKVLDTTLTQGSTFSIEIYVDDVSNMWSYKFVLSYNTTVLTAISNVTYDPFITHLATEINDTGIDGMGYVYMAYATYYGDSEGVTTTEPIAVARIDFEVDALGVSVLDLHHTKLVDPNGDKIAHTSADGSFANVEVHDIVVTSVTASPSRVAAPGDPISINVTLANRGGVDKVFNVTVKYDETSIENKTDIFLGVGENITESFTWDTTGVALGEYTLTAKAVVDIDHYPEDNTYSIKVRVGVIRDIAITEFSAEPPDPYVGEPVILRVTIKNQGDFTENVTLTAKYDGTVIRTKAPFTLAKNVSTTESFTWLTENIAEGTYNASVEASVDIDDDLDNNIATATVTVGPAGFPVPLSLLAGIPIVIIITTTLFYVLRRRKPKPT